MENTHHATNIFLRNARFCLKFAHCGRSMYSKIKMETTPKLEDCSVHCLFVWYSLTHPTRCYRIYGPKMHRVCISFDVIWLHQMFYQKESMVGELNMDYMCVGNWSNKTQGVSQFIEVWREFLKGLGKNWQ